MMSTTFDFKGADLTGVPSAPAVVQAGPDEEPGKGDKPKPGTPRAAAVKTPVVITKDNVLDVAQARCDELLKKVSEARSLAAGTKQVAAVEHVHVSVHMLDVHIFIHILYANIFVYVYIY